MREGVDYTKLERAVFYTTIGETRYATGWLLGAEYTVPGWVSIDRRGDLWLADQYGWDGPSGPMPDIASAMRASLIHDGLSQLFRDAGLPLEFVHASNAIYADVARANGMNRFLAGFSRRMLNRFWKPVAVTVAVAMLGCAQASLPSGLTVVTFGKACIVTEGESVLIKSDGISGNFAGLFGWVAQLAGSVFGAGPVEGSQQISDAGGCDGALVDPEPEPAGEADAA